MEHNHEIDLSKRKFSSRLIVERALARGWDIIGFETNPAIFLITPTGATKAIKVFSAAPPQTSYPASKIAKNKIITNAILRQSGIPVPDEMFIRVGQDYRHQLEEFMSGHQQVVVKPLDSSHGNGVRVGIGSFEEAEAHINQYKHYGERWIVQEQLVGHDIRVLCIGYKFEDSITREPASVTGDGEHTVEELIGIENQQDYRGVNYKSRLNVIPLEVVKQYLSHDELTRIPSQDETVQVVGISNVGVGGVRRNIKHQIPASLIELAEKAAAELELSVCGVDFMVKKLPDQDSTLEELNPKIIEVNECPMLTMYDDLSSPEQNAVVDRYLDFVAENS